MTTLEGIFNISFHFKSTVYREHLKQIYKTFIRCNLEFSSNVWHSSLTEENRQDLERVQKAALKVILKKDYLNYEDALKLTNLPSLDERRQAISSERAELKDLWCLRLMGRPGIRPSQV